MPSVELAVYSSIWCTQYEELVIYCGVEVVEARSITAFAAGGSASVCFVLE